jgi:hypothetical protein
MFTARQNKLEFILHSLIFMGKPKWLPLEWSTIMRTTWADSNLTHKCKTFLKILAAHKHSSLFRPIISDEEKKIS